MTGPFADRLFRIAFALAGCYNLAFGLWAAVWPLAFFAALRNRAAALSRHLGLPGDGRRRVRPLVLARRVEAGNGAGRSSPSACLGKVLGPIGMVMSFSDDWPRRLGMICVYNDLIWWLPFGLFLVRGTPVGRWIVGLAPWLCVATHAAALVMLGLYLRPGSLMEAEAMDRG